MPEIRPVTKENWKELIRLKVREDQTGFVATNLYSIAEAQFGFDDDDGSHWDTSAHGIYDNNGKPVGFLMYGYNFPGPRLQSFIFRLMVDEKNQGMGYGRFGMNWMLEQFKKDDRVKRVGISYEPENEVGRKLYASLGFVETGEMLGDEVLAVLQLR
jgi:diamine N-acetyltransferase